MATIRQNRETLVFLSCDSFIAASKCSLEEIQIPEPAKEGVDQEKPQEYESENSQSKAEDKSVSKNCILASAFSASGKYFAIGDDQKKLHVYKVSPRWELVSSRSIARRCTAVTFPQNEKEVVVADRTGDVYRFSLIDTESDGELLLGHLSMVLDVVVSSDDKYIITCDRDEKIRISHYPNAYNIQAYCLLHTEYVSQVLYLKEFSCLVSGAGDGTLASWSMNGKNLSCTNKAKRDSPNKQQEMDASDNTDNGMVADDSLKDGGRTEGEGHIDESADTPGVKKMIYNEPLKLIAVIYHRSKQLNFFTTEKYDNGCRLLENSHNALAEEPWDICFDCNNRLWILQPCEDSPAVVYECVKDEQGTIQVDNYFNDDDVLRMQKMLRDRWRFFQDSVEWQRDFISLQKARTHDNIQKYLEKKEERINAQKNKQQPPPQKKIKTS